MVLAVLSQQILADSTEGEVPVVKALEVGLSCDETLPWRDTEEEGKRGVRAEAPWGWRKFAHANQAPRMETPDALSPHQSENAFHRRTLTQVPLLRPERSQTDLQFNASLYGRDNYGK